MNMRYLVLVLFALLVLAVAAPPDLRLAVSPYYAFEGTTYTIRITLVPHADNRLLVVAADDGEFVFQRSDRDLDGVNAPTTSEFRWRLPAGEIQISAVLIGVGGVRARAHQRVKVLSRF